MNSRNQISRNAPMQKSNIPQNYNKINFKTFKNNTFSSLKDVEYFLNNFNKLARCLKLYKILK